MSFECEFCNKTFRTKKILKTHQISANYCLKIQNKNNFTSICEYCNKTLTSKRNFDRHMSSCIEKMKHKYNEMEEKYKFEISQLKKEHSENFLHLKQEHNEEILHLKQETKEKYGKLSEEYMELRDEKNILKGKFLITERSQSVVEEIAKQPKKTTNKTTNKISLLPRINLQQENIKTIIDNKFNDNYFFDGQKGVADFANKHLLKGENGEIGYVCTDASRDAFKYKDQDGNLVKDNRATKLTSSLGEPIRRKSSEIAERLTNEKPQIFEVITDRYCDISGIDNFYKNKTFRNNIQCI